MTLKFYKMKKSTINLFSVFALLVVLTFSFGCKKDEDGSFGDDHEYEGGTITDIDGNTYDTIRIGDQTWMAQNMMVTKYFDGTPIANIKDADKWGLDSLGAYCDYNNDASITARYGRLYNWHAVKSDSICPEGWHVPTRNDWDDLKDFIAQDSVYVVTQNNDSCAVALKSSFGWSDNANGDDYYHLRVLPSGCRTSDARFMDIGYFGHFWTPDEYFHKYHPAFPAQTTCPQWGQQCKGHGVQYTFDRYTTKLRVVVAGVYKTRGYSVRCIKDND